MPAPIPVALRERVVALYIPRVVTYEMLADLFGIGRATVSRILRLHRETGGVEPRPPAGGPSPILDSADRERLAELVEETPDATLDDLAALWNDAHPDKRVSATTVWRALYALGYRWKKKHFVRGKLTVPRSSGRGRSSSTGSRPRTQRG